MTQKNGTPALQDEEIRTVWRRGSRTAVALADDPDSTDPDSDDSDSDVGDIGDDSSDSDTTDS